MHPIRSHELVYCVCLNVALSDPSLPTVILPWSRLPTGVSLLHVYFFMCEFNQELLLLGGILTSLLDFLFIGMDRSWACRRQSLKNQPGVLGLSSLQDHIPWNSVRNNFPNYMIDICTRYISRYYIKRINRYIEMISLEEADIPLVGRSCASRWCWIVLEFFQSADSMQTGSWLIRSLWVSKGIWRILHCKLFKGTKQMRENPGLDKSEDRSGS